jgi:nitrous oxidase accessory protein NosD
MSLTKVSFSMITGASVNILDFGAVGDGSTDDTAAIQAALNYSNTQPGWVEVIVPPSPSGSAYIFTTLKAYTKTIFKGTGGVLKLKNGTVNSTGSFYPINNLGETDVVYDGLIVDGNQANNNSYTPTVCDTITCVGARSAVINCVLTDAVDSGIMFSGAGDGRCQNNYVDGAPDLCIYVNDSTGAQQDNAIISGNICKNGKTGGGIGIKRYAANLIISDNVISYCGNGITVEDFGGGVYPTSLQIIDNSLNGIGWTQRASGPAERGISVSACDIFVIANNKIRTCSGQCIYLGTVTKGTIGNNRIGGYTTDPAAQNVGIFIVTATDCNIVGNNISGVQHQGIYSTSPTTCVYSANIVYSTGNGMRFNAATANCIAVNNIVNATSGTDFEIFAGATLLQRDNMAMNLSDDSLTRISWRSVSAGQPLPNAGTLVPFYVGEQVIHLAANTLWIAYGNGTAEYIQIG